jgi:hypothetical protein
MKSDYKSDAVKRMQRRMDFVKRVGSSTWNELNSYGKLKACIMSDLGCRYMFDEVYDRVQKYVENFSPVEAEAILKDEAQIARHAMIIKLTRL